MGEWLGGGAKEGLEGISSLEWRGGVVRREGLGDQQSGMGRGSG